MKLQPSVRYCFVCGVENTCGLHARFYETEGEPREVHVDYAVPKKFEGFPGVTHGGIITALLDEACWRAVFRLDPLRYVVTARLTVRYRRPVPVETPIRVTGRVVEDKGRMIVTAGEIRSADGVLLSEAEVILAEVDPLVFSEAGTLEDWNTYPENEEER